jgi:tetratricopeptide (TPR) repeat protein
MNPSFRLVKINFVAILMLALLEALQYAHWDFRYFYHSRLDFVLSYWAVILSHPLRYSIFGLYDGVCNLIFVLFLVTAALALYGPLPKRYIARFTAYMSTGDPLERSLYLCMLEDFPRLLRLRAWLVTGLNGFLLLSLSFALSLTSLAVLSNLVLIANDCGASGLGEYLYRYSGNDDFVTVASKECWLVGTNAREIETGMSTVSAIYGSESPQVAYLNKELVRHYMYRKDYGAVDKCHKRALDLYKKVGTSKSDPWTLSYLALTLAHTGNSKEAERCIREALGGTQKGDIALGALKWVLYPAAIEIKDKRLTDEIYERIRHEQIIAANEPILPPDRLATLVLCLSLLVAIPTAERWCLAYLNRRWTRMLASSVEVTEIMRTLDKLTTLALYRKKATEADKYSTQLFNLANELARH